MATGNLKSDIINGAYSQMRISGITVIPSASDNILALRRLEGMANEFLKRNICTGYQLEDTPNLNSPSGVDPAYWYAFECVLAQRLLTDFGKGKEPDPILLVNSRSQLSFLYASTADPKQTQYPSRQSIGNGNSLRFGRRRQFYAPASEAPNTCSTNKMVVGDVNDFIEHFDSWLIDGEAVASFVITAETGLTIVSSSLTTPDVSYRISAVGGNSDFLQVKIVATSDGGRITTRLIDFELTTIAALT